MKYLKMFEDNDTKSSSEIDKIKEIIKGNQFLSKHADSIKEDMIHKVGDFIYVELPGELESAHIKKHFDKSGPASVWSIGSEMVSDLILKTLEKKPTKSVQEGPAFKYKWLNIENDKPVGFDSLKKVDGEISKEVDLEPFGMVERVKDWLKIQDVAKQNSYELVAKEEDGKTREYTEKDLEAGRPCFIKQDIGVIEGDKMQNPTKVYNLIVAKVGEIEGKPVVTLMTTFPGVNPVDDNGKDITNKKELAKYGYAFLKSKSKTNESKTFRYLKTFESFSVNENTASDEDLLS